MNVRYIVSMLFVAAVSASAVAVGQSVAAEQPKANCVSTLDYTQMSKEELNKIFTDAAPVGK